MLHRYLFVIIIIIIKEWRRYKKKCRNNWIKKNASYTNLWLWILGREMKVLDPEKLLSKGLCAGVYFGKLLSDAFGWVEREWAAWQGGNCCYQKEVHAQEEIFEKEMSN